VLIDVHAGAVLIKTLGSDSDYVQEEVASESGDVDVDVHVDLEAQRFASTSRGTGKRLSRGRGGGRGNGSTRKFGASTAGQAANEALSYMLNFQNSEEDFFASAIQSLLVLGSLETSGY
jgi:hypothetical protein